LLLSILTSDHIIPEGDAPCLVGRSIFARLLETFITVFFFPSFKLDLVKG
jgi:hypothetical protein